MTKDQAISVANQAAKKERKSMLAVQSKNGQWEVYAKGFARDTPVGHMVAAGRPTVEVPFVQGGVTCSSTPTRLNS